MLRNPAAQSVAARRLLEILEDRCLLAAVSGTVFYDLDQNGSRDPDERGLPGWTVYLDQNYDGLFSSDESRDLTDGLATIHSRDSPQVATTLCKFLRPVGGLGADNLSGSSGDDLIRSGGGVDSLFGDGGNDILLGFAGSGTFFGGEGRDVLVGGLNVDTIFGNSEEDILIGGRTAHDDNNSALGSTLAEWTMLTPFATRQTNLMAGLLSVANLSNDLSADRLNGGADDDWEIEP